jgi:hypothetical protein
LIPASGLVDRRIAAAGRGRWRAAVRRRKLAQAKTMG